MAFVTEAKLADLKPMQRDELLWKNYEQEASTKPVLFFYTWGEPSITVGKIQSNKDSILELAKSYGMPCYQRPTGGKAVLHGGDICFTFIANHNDPEFGGSLNESFAKTNRLINSLVSNVLELEIQCKACNAEDKSIVRQASDNCFETKVGSESFVKFDSKEFKIIGAAQAMGKKTFIQQGSIQLNKLDLDLDLFKSSKTLTEVLACEPFDLDGLVVKLNQSIPQGILNPC